jgi:hypothetical protein
MIDSLAVLVEPDAAVAALQFHLDRNGNKPSKMLAQIAHVLVLVAQHAVGVDEIVLAKLKCYRANLSLPRSGLKPRPRRHPDPARRQSGAQHDHQRQHRRHRRKAPPRRRPPAGVTPLRTRY